MQYKKQRKRFWFYVISFPIIWSMIVPLLILDFFLELYHATCFPLYGLKRVKRKRYIRMDRHRLPYLSFREKTKCFYCGYANGLLRYAKQIVAQTEGYWCGIQHKQVKGYLPDEDQKNFFKYGDEAEFKRFCPKDCCKKK